MVLHTTACCNGNKSGRRENRVKRTIHWRGYFHCLRYHFISSLSLHLHSFTRTRMHKIAVHSHARTWTFKCIYSWAIILRELRMGRIEINPIVNRYVWSAELCQPNRASAHGERMWLCVVCRVLVRHWLSQNCTTSHSFTQRADTISVVGITHHLCSRFSYHTLHHFFPSSLTQLARTI